MERKKLGLKEDNHALHIMDVFERQMTPKVLNVLKIITTYFKVFLQILRNSFNPLTSKVVLTGTSKN